MGGSTINGSSELENDESVVLGNIIKDSDIQSNLLVFDYNSSFEDAMKTAKTLSDQAQAMRQTFDRNRFPIKKVAVLNTLEFIGTNMDHFVGEHECVRNVYIRKINELYGNHGLSKNEYDHYMSFVRV